jgi:hypothetical protein
MTDRSNSYTTELEQIAAELRGISGGLYTTNALRSRQIDEIEHRIGRLARQQNAASQISPKTQVEGSGATYPPSADAASTITPEMSARGLAVMRQSPMTEAGANSVFLAMLALSHGPSDSGWYPMVQDTPREEPLLGVVDGRVRFIQWGKTSHVPMYGWCLADQGTEDFDLCQPTHWRRIPAPPATSKGRS